MSGQAGLSLLESHFEYSYLENSRKSVRSEHYESYWAGKRSYFDGVLAASIPAFKQLASDLEAAKIPIVAIDPSLNIGEKPSSTRHEIEIPGDRGNTFFRFDTKSELTAEQLMTLKKRVALLDFSKLDEAWQAAGNPEAKPDEFVKAVSAAKVYPKYALGVFLIRGMRKEVAEGMRTKVRNILTKISTSIEKEMETKIASGKIWVDPKQLVSFEQKFGSDFRLKLDEQNPGKSVFNPYGPLHDDVGRRTSAQVGMMVATVLFLTKDSKWIENSPFGKNTAEFETWFREAVNRP